MWAAASVVVTLTITVDLTTPSPSRQMSRRVASAAPADATPLGRAPREPRVVLERVDLTTPSPASRHVPAATTSRPPDDDDGDGGAPSEVPQGFGQRREGIITPPPSTSREAGIMGSTPRPKRRKRASATTILPISPPPPPPAAAIPTIRHQENVHIQMQRVGRKLIMTQTSESVQPVVDRREHIGDRAPTPSLVAGSSRDVTHDLQQVVRLERLPDDNESSPDATPRRTPRRSVSSESSKLAKSFLRRY
ncbi:PREDICTED: mucin-7-like [Wasmannia auropunctata]|uniref:mucin-7-like n=1 Tax=Wasmannia auropunctata TaxID=64793 RepID=UPI0005F0A486|nr:PREDICTED: mucin-7-like [Wasmannia auropunctata]